MLIVHEGGVSWTIEKFTVKLEKLNRTLNFDVRSTEPKFIYRLKQFLEKPHKEKQWNQFKFSDFFVYYVHELPTFVSHEFGI